MFPFLIFTLSSSQYRIDMVIGQDLLNAHFNMTPLQPTYHITPSLANIRTKMGLAFIGKFDIEKFKQWTLCAVDAETMKKALCPESKSDLLNDIEMSPAKREELNKMLTVNISDIKRSWCEYICKCILPSFANNILYFNF